MALATRLELNLSTVLTGTNDFSTPTASTVKQYVFGLTTGTGAGQADLAFHDQRSLSTGANEDIDLAGALTHALGATLTLVKLKLVVIYALSANTTNLTVSRPASNGVPFLSAASDAFVLTPGGLFALGNPSAAAIAVTAGTGDLINIANAAGATATYDIHIVGTSA